MSKTKEPVISEVIMADFEMATVIAALRFWQLNNDDHDDSDIATMNGSVTAMTDEEIDTLCENINMGPDGRDS